jgi:thiamine kinase-like enzyme
MAEQKWGLLVLRIPIYRSRALPTGSIAPGHDERPPAAQFPDAEYARAVLADALPELVDGEAELRACRLKWSSTNDPAGSKRKVLAVYAIEYGEKGSSEVTSEQVLVKLYRSGRGRTSFDGLRKLWDAGLRTPNLFRVPRPRGYSRAHDALAQEHVRGTSWIDHLREEPATAQQASELAAEWLLALQKSDVDARPHQHSVEAETVLQLAGDLVRSFPSHERTLKPLADAVVAELRRDRHPSLASHGDFHGKNVLLSSRAVTAIDLDYFGVREPAFDVGYAIAQLLIMAHLVLGDISRGYVAASAFWRRYRREGEAPSERVAVHVARTFLQSLHHELCTYRNGRVDLLETWPQLAALWLDGDGIRSL